MPDARNPCWAGLFNVHPKFVRIATLGFGHPCTTRSSRPTDARKLPGQNPFLFPANGGAPRAVGFRENLSASRLRVSRFRARPRSTLSAIGAQTLRRPSNETVRLPADAFSRWPDKRAKSIALFSYGSRSLCRTDQPGRPRPQLGLRVVPIRSRTRARLPECVEAGKRTRRLTPFPKQRRRTTAWSARTATEQKD